MHQIYFWPHKPYLSKRLLCLKNALHLNFSAQQDHGPANFGKEEAGTFGDSSPLFRLTAEPEPDYVPPKLKLQRPRELPDPTT